MERINAKRKAVDVIEFSSVDELEKFSKSIETEKKFILTWKEKEDVMSELIFSTNITSKIKNGEIKLTSVEEK